MKIITHIMVAMLLTVLSMGMTVNAAEKNKQDPMQFVRGAKAWSTNCERCHNLRGPKEFSDNGWDIIGTHMQVRANIPGNLINDIIAFLKASNNEKVDQ